MPLKVQMKNGTGEWISIRTVKPGEVDEIFDDKPGNRHRVYMLRCTLSDSSEISRSIGRMNIVHTGSVDVVSMKFKILKTLMRGDSVKLTINALHEKKPVTLRFMQT